MFSYYYQIKICENYKDKINKLREKNIYQIWNYYRELVEFSLWGDFHLNFTINLELWNLWKFNLTIIPQSKKCDIQIIIISHLKINLIVEISLKFHKISKGNIISQI